MRFLVVILSALVSAGTTMYRYEDVINTKSNDRSDFLQNAPILPIHRLSECPWNARSFKFGTDCELTNSSRSASSDNSPVIGYNYSCGYFKQLCFNETMEITCRDYERTCNVSCSESAEDYNRSCDILNNCIEVYGYCVVNNLTMRSEVAPKPGVPAKIYPECIPALQPLRDQCEADFRQCNTEWTFDKLTDELTHCTMNCKPTYMKCYNYTRNCTEETMRVFNMTGRQQIIVDKSSNCTTETFRRRINWDIEWKPDLEYEDEASGLMKVGKAVNVPVNYTDTIGLDDGWDQCKEKIRIPYNFQCNQFMFYMMKALKPVPYEPLAHNLTNGIIDEFLAKWDGGYEILCKWDCFYHIIKFSRACWPYIPLQRLFPGADYRTTELLLRNISRIGCYITDAPLIKQEEEWRNARNSCAVFFDVDHNITKPYYVKINKYCQGDEMCNEQCTEALDGISARFGCCLGSIVYQYNVSYNWLQLMNFANQPIIERLIKCKTKLTQRCEQPIITALVLDILTWFVWILGVIMGIVCCVMIISFYWQHEHEPLQKAFYHF